MDGKFVDANIFLEIVTRTGTKSDRCLALLESGKRLWTTILIFSELEWVLRDFYDWPREKISNFLKKVLSYQNLFLENKKEIVDAVVLYETTNIDWTDCHTVVMLNLEDQKELYSYDKHFNKIDNLNRLEP